MTEFEIFKKCVALGMTKAGAAGCTANILAESGGKPNNVENRSPMSDEEYTLANCNTVIENREYASRELRNLGFTVTNSVTNFIFCAHPTIGGEEINSKLREKGILVRHFKQERIANYNRITVGSLSQMKSLIKALEEIIEEKK